MATGMLDREQLMKGFRIGQWTVLPERGLVRVDVAEEHIEPKVMEVLVRLAAANGEVVSKQTLMDEVWGDSPSGDEVITRCIAVLRHAFQDDARRPQIIETLSRRGYRLMVPISGVDDGPVESSPTRSHRPLFAGVVAIAVVAGILAWWWPASDPGEGSIESLAVFTFECGGNLVAMSLSIYHITNITPLGQPLVRCVA